MHDRETVITHLQIIHTWAEFAHEHNLQFITKKHLADIAQWAFDAIALLKEQEPHVLSRDEMKEAGKNHDAVYVEEGVGRCFWGLAVEGIDPPEDKPYNYPGGVQFNVVDAYDDMWDGDFYLLCDVYPEPKPHPMGWRAWSAKPTPEQMRVVKWE